MASTRRNPSSPTPTERESHPALSGFRAPLRAWFAASFEAPTRAQELAWPLIRSGQTSLILAPTGSGKTLAAFLAAIDQLMFDPVPDKKRRCRVLYISPLKALAVDVERNLRAPLVGVSRMAERMGHPFHQPEVAIRTGDTPSKERAQFSRRPADILITTPESLFLLLTSSARDALRSVRWVIVDEVHAMVGTKRGAHLALSLERLEELTERPLQRIGLSATVRPVEEAARFLGGFHDPRRAEGPAPEGDGAPAEAASGGRDAEGPADAADPGEQDWIDDFLAELQADDADSPAAPETSTTQSPNDAITHQPNDPPPLAPRPVAVVDAGKTKELDLTVEVAVEDMARLGEAVELPSGPADQGEVRGSIWPAIYPLVLDLIRQHRSSLIFVNSRRLAERLAAALNELAEEDIVRAHHGSVAREQRLLIEDELKSGRLPAMVATSSLELGIDMGAIDLVVQIEAPPSVASGVQRIGRAGHHIGVPSKGVIVPKFRGDLLACAALTDLMRAGHVEAVRYPRNPLDVLAQQIVAMVAMEEWTVERLEAVVRRAAPYAQMPRSMLDSVLDMLSGRYPSDDFAELKPRLTWDRFTGTLRAREGARRIAIANSGTIPDRGLYGVYLVGEEYSGRRGSARVGELDEEMVHESRVGGTFVLGASTWRIEEITHDRVLVSPAPGEPGQMPFWHGDRAGRPLEFGRAIGSLCRTLREKPRPEATRLLVEKHSLTEGAARNLLDYLEEQAEATGVVPDDRNIVVERYMDEMGDWRVCVLSPFGSKVHAPWAMALAALVRERTSLETEILWTDDGIVVRFPESEEPPSLELLIPEPDEVEDLVVRQLGFGGGAREDGFGTLSSLFGSRFREAAARALLLPRRYPGQRAPLWQQRRRAADLLHATAHYGSFPIVLETYRECLRDVFDMPALVELLREIQRRQVRVVTVTSRTPSPFAASLMFNYVANFMYEGDSPLAERRAQALTVDPVQLRELLGEVELRELLDPEALETLELQLQCLTEDRKARHADALHDLLLRLGDLTAEEAAARCHDAPQGEAAPSPNDPTTQQPNHQDSKTPSESGIGGAAAEQRAPQPPNDRGRGCGATRPPTAQQPHDPTTQSPNHPSIHPWLLDLERQRRAIRLNIAGEARYAAVEDAARYRDALGVPLPPGLPAAFLESPRDPLGDLVLRYARTHGPFHAADVAARFGVGIAPVLGILNALESTGRLVQGEFRPNGSTREWCEAGVLRTLRQRSLAKLRHEVEPVEPGALGRLYAAWQGLTARRGPEALLEVLEQIQGVPIPASDLESRVLPARIDDYSPADLDALTTSGIVLWVGVEGLGERDGRVALYLAEHAPLLMQPPANPPDGPVHRGIREHLAARGASFFPHLLQACPGASQEEVLRALWDLVWAGEVTNDTLQPLRAFLYPRHRSRSAPRGRVRAPRARALYPPESSGRWSLVSSLLLGQPSTTERLTARARQLLDRFGVLTREAVHAEGIPGGFSALYPVLRRMEEAGHIRRGYFVSGLGALQFSLPGAVDRLRSLREPGEEMQSVLMAATDPANPYGVALPWPQPSSGESSGAPGGNGRGAPAARAPVPTNGPLSPPTPASAPTEQLAEESAEEDEGGVETAVTPRRASRSAGASVVLVDGLLAAWVSRAERQVLTFFDQMAHRDPEEVAEEVARALAAQVRPGGRRSLYVRQVDGLPAQHTALGPALLKAGFTFGPQGYMKRL